MLNFVVNDVQILLDFLKVPTPEAWLCAAVANLPLLLVDHAHCERKAAATAINFMSKYPEKAELVAIMSPLAREELLHFEKVIALLKLRHIKFCSLEPSNYAQQLHDLVTKKNTKERLRDLLIIGAIIEARSCERFSALVPRLRDRELSKFYASLVKSEARHFQNYLHLARLYGGDIVERVGVFIEVENQLVSGKDRVFRFHSGVPAFKED